MLNNHKKKTAGNIPQKNIYAVINMVNIFDYQTYIYIENIAKPAIPLRIELTPIVIIYVNLPTLFCWCCMLKQHNTPSVKWISFYMCCWCAHTTQRRNVTQYKSVASTKLVLLTLLTKIKSKQLRSLLILIYPKTFNIYTVHPDSRVVLRTAKAQIWSVHTAHTHTHKHNVTSIYIYIHLLN